MRELTQNEVDVVNGGVLPMVVPAIAGLILAAAIGAYNGYQEAKRGDKNK